MKLTDMKLRSLTDPAKYFDGNGLYLEVTKAGGKYWRLKYRIFHKEKRLALGVYPAVGLKEARDGAIDARRLLREGIDPSEVKKAEKAKVCYTAANNLETVTRDWLTHQSARWAPVTLQRITSAFQNDIFPSLGAREVGSIRPGEVMAVIKKIEARGAGDQAGRVLQRVKSVYRWAVIHERIDSNPMLDLVLSEILKPRAVRHRAAMSDRELPEFLKRLDAYEGDPHTIAALQLLFLTGTRPGEVRGARWDEIDLESAVWVIPGERMKMGVEHKVPLSKQAVKILEKMQSLSGHSGLIFPSPFYPSKPLSDNTFNSALARMGYKNSATAHGFRALFSTVANEAGWNSDVIERQLAHKEQNTVRAAYHRSTYLPDRAVLLQWWADYIDKRRIGKFLARPPAG